MFVQLEVVASLDDGFNEFRAECGTLFCAPLDIACTVLLNPVSGVFLTVGELYALVQEISEFLLFFLGFFFHVGMNR